ncbi:trypsin-like peptidase domain-containing protein [Streptomyces sp. NPDC059037]|uniref:trypsin-like peptidase domain-containing protein n=1 Tax=Streptomyces sp. NPDC059037 TaxID=3346710 RepID=UPI00369D9263
MVNRDGRRPLPLATASNRRRKRGGGGGAAGAACSSAAWTGGQVLRRRVARIGAASGLDVGRVGEVIVAGGGGTHRRGSGYLVAAGRVLTTAHVIGDAHLIQVRFDADQPTEQVHRAEIAWVDPGVDVAVLTVDGDQQHVAWTDFGRVPEQDAELRCSTMGLAGSCWGGRVGGVTAEQPTACAERTTCTP